MLFTLRLIRTLLLSSLVFALGILGINYYVTSEWAQKISSSNEQFELIEKDGYGWVLESPYVAVVLGASVSRDGSLSPILQQRVDKVYELYIQGIVSKILVSWFDQDSNYMEATSMRMYLTSLGVSSNDILVDSYGYDTLASMQHISDFGVDKVLVISQYYHLYRALYYTDYIDPTRTYIWIPADQNPSFIQKYANSREMLARVKAFVEMGMIHRKLEDEFQQFKDKRAVE